MAESDTRSVQFTGAPAVSVGTPGEYLDRPGFWHGAIGVSACWLGGARAVAAPLYARATRESVDPHTLAHLGAVDAAIAAAEATLLSAASQVDADPLNREGRAELIARRTRAVVETAVDETITRTGRALGPGPLAQDAKHAGRVADLTMYVRQSHAERDLAAARPAGGTASMTARLPDEYFGRMYEESADPWQLQERWYEQRKFAITLALLPLPRFRHAFEPGCSVGVLTEQLAGRCDRVTATDLVPAALEATGRRLKEAGVGEGVTLMRRSLDEEWPATDFDLIVLSEVGYYLEAAALRGILDRELPRLTDTATIVAAHWRHPVADYPMTGDETNDVIAATPGLHRIGGYRDDDVTVDVFDTATSESVAARTGVPGASPSEPE